MATKAFFEVSLDKVDFEKELELIEEDINSVASITVEERAQYATDSLRKLTPVDTGEARAGWQLNRTINKGILGGPPEISQEIINEVPHITYLNQGSSQQAPAFFIERILQTIGIITE